MVEEDVTIVMNMRMECRVGENQDEDTDALKERGV